MSAHENDEISLEELEAALDSGNASIMENGLIKLDRKN